MKALVTGANRFTGSYLVKHLLNRVYEVRGLERPNSDFNFFTEKKILITEIKFQLMKVLNLTAQWL